MVVTADKVWTSPAISDPPGRVCDYWRVVDQWWTQSPVEREYMETELNGKKVVWVRHLPNKNWERART